MTDADRDAILARIFVRTFRSLGQYLRLAWPRFDVANEQQIRTLVNEEEKLADELGSLLVERNGAVDMGGFPAKFSDLHFVNFSRILPEWTQLQQRLISDLKEDRAAITPGDEASLQIVDRIIDHEKKILHSLEAITPVHSHG